MKNYKVLSLVKLYTGKIRLTPEQAAIRGYCLQPLGNDLYQITGQACFKPGEVIGLIVVEKVHVQLLEEIVEPVAEPEPVKPKKAAKK